MARPARPSPNFFRLPRCIWGSAPDFYAAEAVEGVERLRQLAFSGRAEAIVLDEQLASRAGRPPGGR